MSAEPAANKPGQINVAIVGAGISGLAVANGLLKDPAGRFDVQVYERDTKSFNSERGGYQLRISKNGLDALRTISDKELWHVLRDTWCDDKAKSPNVVDPKDFDIHLRLANIKLYPENRPVLRTDLRQALLQPLLSQGRVHFNHQITRFEYLSGAQVGVKLHFNGQDSQEADILVAADGSNSVINRQVGLNNKVKLEDWTLIQSREAIDDFARDKLPKSLLDAGSVMFLGGRRTTGFVSIYDPKLDVGGSSTQPHSLFWSLLVPRAEGEKMLAKVGDNVKDVVPLLAAYFRGLGYGEALPTIMMSATEHLRTGLLTSSARPKEDWRKSDPNNSRVILLGDAVHPMTPGRGMGANQALTDAGKLVTLLLSSNFEKQKPSDQELASLVHEFDTEMYERAFKMVKASEAVTDVDLTKFSGRISVRLLGLALTVLGWGASILEMLRLRKEEKIDFLSHSG